MPDEGLLGAVEREARLAGLGGRQLLPSADAVEDAFDLKGVRALQVLAFLAEAFAPDLHDAHTLTAHGSFLGGSAKFVLTQKAAALIQIHDKKSLDLLTGHSWENS